MCRLAKLSEEELKSIQELEARLGRIVLVAYEKPPELAKLTEEQLEEIKGLEAKLNLKLVAYK